MVLRFLPALSVAGLLAVLTAAPAVAADRPEGIWLDHDQRGAVLIASCGAGLCGTVVWVREDAGRQACGLQVIGDLRQVATGVWDNGWILDPEVGEKFDVELTLRADGTLQVLGYLGVKSLSETFEWRRAPADLELCADAATGAASRQAAATPTK